MRERGPRRRWPWRRTRGDRGALDREVLTREVDVVQFVPIDEPSGCDVADDGVVLPAVPEPGGPPQPRRNRPRRTDRPPRISRRPNRSASCVVPLTRTSQRGRLRETKSSVAMAFETGKGSVLVMVATGIRPMWFVIGATREADQHRVGPAREQLGSSSGRRRRRAVSASSKVTKSSKPAFGGRGQAGPVPATRHGLGVGRVPPCLPGASRSRRARPRGADGRS